MVERDSALLPFVFDWKARFRSRCENHLDSIWRSRGSFFPDQARLLLLPLHLLGRVLRWTVVDLQHSSRRASFLFLVPRLGTDDLSNLLNQRSTSIGGSYVDQAGKAANSGGGTLVLASHGSVRRRRPFSLGFFRLTSLTMSNPSNLADHRTRRRISSRRRRRMGVLLRELELSRFSFSFDDRSSV